MEIPTSRQKQTNSFGTSSPPPKEDAAADNQVPGRNEEAAPHALYWSVLHHKNLREGESTSAHPTIHDVEFAKEASEDLPIPEVALERQPLVDGTSTQWSALTGYNSTNSSSVPPPTTPQQISPDVRVSEGSAGWGRLKDAVDSKELFTRHSVTKSGALHKKWSDLKMPHELTLRECFLLFLALLAIGALAYSFLFEDWPIIDSLYFTTILLTTVGYGDIAPTTTGGRLFASTFALGGIVLLGLALGVVGSYIVENEISYAEKMKSKSSRVLERAFAKISHRKSAIGHDDVETSDRSLTRSNSLESIDSVGSISTSSSYDGEHHRERCPGLSVIKQHLPGFLPMLIGGLIMALLERWGAGDAIYYCVVTATTIGFGDLHPETDVGKCFAIIFVPIVVGAMGYILGNLATFVVDRRREDYTRRLWSNELKIEDLKVLDEGQDGGVSELEYIKFMLVAMKKIDGALFDELHNQFVQLDLTGNGQITKKDLALISSRKMSKASHKLKLSAYKHHLMRQGKSDQFIQATMRAMSDKERSK